MKIEQITAKRGFQVPGLNAIDGERKVVLMAHGFGSEKQGHTPLYMTKGLKQAGFGVYGFDFPAHGDSPLDGNQLTMENCVDSYAAAEAGCWSWLPARRSSTLVPASAPTRPWLYLGHPAPSGAESLSAFRRHRHAPADLAGGPRRKERPFRRDGYCDLTYYNRPLRLTWAFCEDMNRYDIFALYQAGTAQLRMIHGERDSVASPAVAQKFAAEKGAELILVPGAEHRLMEPGNPERALQASIDFFEGK